jgi:hypothetical protein
LSAGFPPAGRTLDLPAWRVLFALNELQNIGVILLSWSQSPPLNVVLHLGDLMMTLFVALLAGSIHAGDD